MIVSSKSLDEASDEVNQFIRDNVPPTSKVKSEDVIRRVTEFVQHHQTTTPPRIAVITSGGTIAPLEQQHIRYITNLSTGQRGAASAEQFLALGYRVVFLHKEGSLLPFVRKFQSGYFALESDEVYATMAESGRVFRNHVESGRLLLIPFNTVAEYMLVMRDTLTTLGTKLGPQLSRGIVLYLVAAVADFYIPWSELPPDKIDSKPFEDSMTVYLKKVPKALSRGLVGNYWGKDVFITTFKLETKKEGITEKLLRYINGYNNIKLVVANVLATCRDEVFIYDSPDPETYLTIRRRDGEDIEAPLVQTVVERHQAWLQAQTTL